MASYKKYPELIAWYRDYEWEKCSYKNFFFRVVRYWYPKEKAIKKRSYKWSYMIKTEIRDEGRVCTNCLKFKLWSEFAKTKDTSTGRTSNCLSCRKEKSRRERAEGRTKDSEYKKKRRMLKIWSYVAFLNPVIIDWAPREDTREVISYSFKKGYQIRSVHTGLYKTLDTNDNRKVNQNSVPFYRVDRPIELADNSKPTLLAWGRNWIDE